MGRMKDTGIVGEVARRNGDEAQQHKNAKNSIKKFNESVGRYGKY